MTAALFPPDETERLANLRSYGLLDSGYERVFDEIAALAAKICGMPYAFISLVDRDRQWFKAAHGVDGLSETPRDISFCSHAILHDSLMHVPDAREDERFAGNPFVTGELGIRVYAGMPLRSEEGHKLGALCVLSDRPTPLAQWQSESLEQLALVVGELFAARRKERRLVELAGVMDQLADEVALADAGTLQCTYLNTAARRALGEAAPSLQALAGQAEGAPGARMLEELRTGPRRKGQLEVHRAGAPGKADTVIEWRLQRLDQPGAATIAAIGHDISERIALDRERQLFQQELERRNAQLTQAYGVLREELAVAREMQLRFLPAPKCIERVCFDWLFHASNYLSGDVFDYFPINERYLCFHVMDVSGHGLSAALLAFNAQRQLFSARGEMAAAVAAARGDIVRAAPGIVAEFNRRFTASNESSLYLTMLFALLDTKTGEVALVQAGHPPPLLSEPDGGAILPVGDGGLPVGLFEHAEYEAQRLRLAPGARLFLYSDGVTDCANPAAEPFGHDRMQQVLADHRAAPLSEVRAAMDAALLDWHGSERGFEDDVTFLSLEFLRAGRIGHDASAAH